MSESAQTAYGAQRGGAGMEQQDNSIGEAKCSLSNKGSQFNRSPESTIEYIAELTDQLTQLASSINEDSLAYFLSMARAEAELLALRARNTK